MTLVNVLVAKLRRQWISWQVSFYYGHWTFQRCLLCCAVISVFGLCLFLIYQAIFTAELLPWSPSFDRWCDSEEVPQHMLRMDSDEITVVTMYINLGAFKNGEQLFSYHSPYKYKRWMRTFGRMVNRVVAYIEHDDDIEYFRLVRSCLPESHTKIIKIDRQQLEAFKHLQQIKTIYSRPSYLTSQPNNIYGEYTCAMHAKFDVLEKSCLMDFYESPFFAWLDIGLFRNLDGTDYPLFKLVPPDKFHPERVGFSQAWPQDPVHTPDYIMRNNLVWVSGGTILAAKEYMLNLTRDYKNAVQELLEQGLSGSDQQILYAMYSAKMRKAHYPKIKTYLCHRGQLGLYGADSRYFCLGYVCKNAWEKRVPNHNVPGG